MCVASGWAGTTSSAMTSRSSPSLSARRSACPESAPESAYTGRAPQHPSGHRRQKTLRPDPALQAPVTRHRPRVGDMTSTRTERIAAPGGDHFHGHVWAPDGGAGAGILLLQEIFGVGGYLRAVAKRLCAMGYTVMAPDLFWRIERNRTRTRVRARRQIRCRAGTRRLRGGARPSADAP